VALGYGPGLPHRDSQADPAWTEPLADLVNAYNLARDETMGLPVKQIIAQAQLGDGTPRVVSSNT